MEFLMNLLQAINMILPYVGEFPVDSIDGYQNPTVEQVRQTLQMQKTSLLTKGYWFNTEKHQLQPDFYKQVQLPDSVLDYYIEATDMCRLGIKSYWLQANTLISDKGDTWDTAVPCTLIFDKEFDNLPDAAQQVLVFGTAAQVYQQIIGTDDTYKMLLQMQSAKNIELQRSALRHQRPSVGTSLSARLWSRLWR